MASPFRYFRKHQKLFIATAAVVAMFVFVLADPLMSWLQQSTGGAQGSPTATVASWDGGSLNGRELDRLTQRRYFISNFLEALQMTGAQRVVEEGGTPLRPNVPSFVLSPEESEPSNVMVSVITTRVLSQLAAETGMNVSDEMINHYLREFGLRKVTDQDITEILQRVGRGNLRASEDQLFSGLRDLLLANYYIRSYNSVTQNVLPEQRWQDWKKLNDRITLEAGIVPVDQFVSKAPEPSDAQLQAFYELHKEAIGGIRPGFREPRQVKLQYLLGDINVWTDKLLDSVTDEEIADYYERNKRTQFVKPEDTTTELTTESDAPAEQESEADPEAKEGDEPTETPPEEPEVTSDDEPAAEKEAETSEADSANGDAENETSEESSPEPSEEESTDSSDAGEEASSKETSSEETSPEEPAAEGPAADESSNLKLTSPFRLVAFQAEEEEPATATEESEPAPNAEEPAEDADEPPTEEPPAEKVDEPAAEEEGEPAAEESAEESSDEAEKPVEYEPLENVSDQIRRRLANDKAVEELKRAMERAYADLQSEYNRYGGEVIMAHSEEREPPAPPAKLSNLGTTAKELGLVQEETTLLTQQELADTFVGKARDAQTNRQPVWHAAFESLQPYEPFLAQDLDGNWYLAMKVEDVASRVPPFDEIRDQVVKAWKQEEAAKLALEAAEKFAVEAEESGETLAGFFADKGYRVVATDLFSWLTFGTTPMEMQRGPRLGEAPPLEGVGPQFMQEAFELEPGQVVALLNSDQTDAYVIRLDRREKTEEELRTLFLSEANNWYGGQIMTTSRWQLAQRRLINELTNRVNLDLTNLQEYLQPDEEG